MLPDTLSTARLHLRPVEAGDARAIFERYAQDPEVTRYMTWRPHRDLAETDGYVASCLALDPALGRVLAIVGRGDGLLRGNMHLRRPARHRVEFGYCLARAFWGDGLMTEALRATVAWALAEPNVASESREGCSR